MVRQPFVTVSNLFLRLHDELSESGDMCQVFLTRGPDRGDESHVSAVLPTEKDLIYTLYRRLRFYESKRRKEKSLPLLVVESGFTGLPDCSLLK